MTLLAPTLQAFFTERLMRQLQASSHTIRSYRTTWRLLLLFAAAQKGKAPSALDFADLGTPLITCFLDHLEHQRGNTARTRNLRLAAIHSMFAYAAPQHPEHADDIARVLAIPGKRFRTTVITYLTEEEITALLQAPDPGTWTGRRDHALILVAITTALTCPALAGKHPTPHTLRHTCAVRMLRSGIDIAVIALWMGHESTQTTMTYLKADLELKQRALDRTVPTNGQPGRYRPPDDIINFLDQL